MLSVIFVFHVANALYAFTVDFDSVLDQCCAVVTGEGHDYEKLSRFIFDVIVATLAIMFLFLNRGIQNYLLKSVSILINMTAGLLPHSNVTMVQQANLQKCPFIVLLNYYDLVTCFLTWKKFLL